MFKIISVGVREQFQVAVILEEKAMAVSVDNTLLLDNGQLFIASTLKPEEVYVIPPSLTWRRFCNPMGLRH